jgi:5-formyltetrahydrofolate cyclo-ligase
MDKSQLRRQLRSRLLGMSSQQRADKSKKACHNLIETPQFQNADVIMMYLALPHEADTASAILHAWQQGKMVVVPKISWQQRHIIPVQITSLETGFATEPSGLRNPVSGVPIPTEEIDLVVTPGLGFDKKGNRLGRGGAYYDRFFEHQQLKAHRCGFAFDEQLIDLLPVHDHDKLMDLLVTDKEVLYFDNREEK